MQCGRCGEAFDKKVGRTIQLMIPGREETIICPKCYDEFCAICAIAGMNKQERRDKIRAWAAEYTTKEDNKMKCDRCHKPTDEKSSRNVSVPELYHAVDICDKCYDEYCILRTTSKTMLRRAIRKWFEFKALGLFPEFDETRHRILSIASGVMFELITEMVETDAIGGIVGVRLKMKELLADIDFGTKDEPCAHDMV